MTTLSRVLVLLAFHVLVGCGQGEGPVYEPPSDGGGAVKVGLDFNVCPRIESSMVHPHEVRPGEVAAVAVSAKDPEGGRVSYRWRATSGSFSERSQPRTGYTCDLPGAQTLTATATDTESCSTEGRLDVSCLDE